jgi:hypothetical protein
MINKKVGEYTVVGNASVWPHEIKTAEALKNAGYHVKFIPPSNRKGDHSADCYIDGVLWEMKAPDGATMSVVERNLRRGLKQSSRIVFDSRRIKRIPDNAIARAKISIGTHLRTGENNVRKPARKDTVN